MTNTIEILRALEHELRRGGVPSSIEELSERLNPLSIGVTQRIPVAFSDTRMFRARRMDHKPTLVNEVGAPPPERLAIGRLNDEGQSVLYLSDSPDTAFAESRATAGEFCLSEWRVNVEKLAMVNGGISPKMLAERFKIEIHARNQPLLPPPNASDEEILSLFREIFTLDIGENRTLYRWSVACGLVNGFSHRCERQAVEAEGVTRWNGRYPFAAIAYPSVRMDRSSINYACNDLGQEHLRLDHVQWVRRAMDGSYASLDFANSWDSERRIAWQNRPARLQLKSGEQSKLTKIAENAWRYETADGSVPWFS